MMNEKPLTVVKQYKMFIIFVRDIV